MFKSSNKELEELVIPQTNYPIVGKEKKDNNSTKKALGFDLMTGEVENFTIKNHDPKKWKTRTVTYTGIEMSMIPDRDKPAQ